jgi:hypothetical protein
VLGPGCNEVARYKIAASWSDGTGWELKNYGLACEAHRGSQLGRGQLHRRSLVLADGEVVGDVGVFDLKADTRDATPNRRLDHAI